MPCVCMCVLRVYVCVCKKYTRVHGEGCIGSASGYVCVGCGFVRVRACVRVRVRSNDFNC